MADVTVKELAETVGAPVDRLLKQMQDAGLPHTADEDAVSEEEKQELLAYLKRSHGEAEGGPRKITLTRKSVSTLKAGQGKGRTVAVEVREEPHLRQARRCAGRPAKGPVADAAGRHAKRRSEVASGSGSGTHSSRRRCASKRLRKKRVDVEARRKPRTNGVARRSSARKKKRSAAKAAPKVEETDKARLEREAAEAVAQAQADRTEGLVAEARRPRTRRERSSRGAEPQPRRRIRRRRGVAVAKSR